MAIAYLCLGTNSGDRARLVEQAVNFLNLADGIKIIRTSALYETEPWGVKEQNWFLNIDKNLAKPAGFDGQMFEYRANARPKQRK